MISEKLSRYRECIVFLINIQELMIKYGYSEFLLNEKEKLKKELEEIRVSVIS